MARVEERDALAEMVHRGPDLLELRPGCAAAPSRRARSRGSARPRAPCSSDSRITALPSSRTKRTSRERRSPDASSAYRLRTAASASARMKPGRPRRRISSRGIPAISATRAFASSSSPSRLEITSPSDACSNTARACTSLLSARASAVAEAPERVAQQQRREDVGDHLRRPRAPRRVGDPWRERAALLERSARSAPVAAQSTATPTTARPPSRSPAVRMASR